MSVDTTSPPTATTATPPPLSPDDFGDGTGTTVTGPGTTGTGTSSPGSIGTGITAPMPSGDGVLTPSDRLTLQTARSLLQAARSDMKSDDQATSEAAHRQLRAVSIYLIGFCDARGLISEAPVRPGFSDVFGSEGQPDIDTALDKLDRMLDQLISAADTRSVKSFVGALGDVAIAVGVALIFL